MHFTISGDFTKAPKLEMDGIEVKYRDLNATVWPEMELPNDDGSMTKYPASARLVFSVSEEVGNLKVDKYYHVKASESKEGKLVVEELSEVEAAKHTMKPKMKKCPDCGKMMKDCECDDEETEAQLKKGTPLLKGTAYTIYNLPPAPGTRAYKEEVMREVAEGLTDVKD